MPSLKDYRNRITSVKSTRKITSAMKMVAASKLRRAQENAEKAQPYASAMAGMLARVAAGVVVSPSLPRLLIGTGSEQTHLLIVMTGDRGLAGGFNANLVRFARARIRELEAQGRTVKIVAVGRKARDLLRRDHKDKMIKARTEISQKGKVPFAAADQLADYLLEEFGRGTFDVATLIYNDFKNILSQVPTAQQIVPFRLPEAGANDNTPKAPYTFEPSENALLASLLPRNLSVQIYRAMLDSEAGFYAAQMTAMDNATRNAGELIKKLTLQYNRARQAFITKELIEIISGAEAV
ncbi:MAG: F0F1 ATP synthase subunit gamma [Rhodospirillales bacterium]|nr:F0F1 ATP synthase subunit gamma [Alphaproteobacteria bacterium]MCB9986291.1 F0F1 ATP synthase subunit gamma [Rhodospirillales bacterium]USO07156.1 MAG: F0F1 ATP synthase subunit gamma [Rhodospirillales bacterium]